jgi:hypothetical protein
MPEELCNCFMLTSPPPEVCDSPDHVADCHILGLHVWTFVSDETSGSSGSKKPSCFLLLYKNPILLRQNYLVRRENKLISLHETKVVSC